MHRKQLTETKHLMSLCKLNYQQSNREAHLVAVIQQRGNLSCKMLFKEIQTNLNGEPFGLRTLRSLISCLSIYLFSYKNYSNSSL